MSSKILIAYFSREGKNYIGSNNLCPGTKVGKGGSVKNAEKDITAWLKRLNKF
jgi:hypothetical protein